MFEKQGFDIVESVLSDDECAGVEKELQNIGLAGAGTRNLLAEDWCARLAADIRRHPRIARLVPGAHVAVQCTLFEKSRTRNWLVSLHQDLSIPVAARVNHPTLTGWSEKQDATYVQPPLGVLEDLVAVRVHIDPCGPDDGPLKVVPGSHVLGLVSAEAGLAIRNDRTEVACPAPRGAALVMRPLLLHASSKATGHSRRRVLHFLYGPRELPHGLRWQAI
jgi:ectoine hydroxylase-related dioxygenase (phytanoyl-CoA dioxygenase family)